MTRSIPRSTLGSILGVRHRGSVAYRRLLARHPWVHWLIVVLLATATAAHLLDRDDRIERARDAWGDTRPVLVVDRAAAPGEPIAASLRDVPRALVPDAALDVAVETGATALTARHHLGQGEILTALDVAGGGSLPLLPANWLAVPIVESPPSGAAVGDRVQLASDGIVIAGDALVVGHLDDVTLVAVPAELAPAISPASESGGLVVLRRP